MSAIAKEFEIPTNQVLTLFNKALHKIHIHFNRIMEREFEVLDGDEKLSLSGNLPDKSFEEELEEGAKIVKKNLSERRAILMKESSKINV